MEYFLSKGEIVGIKSVHLPVYQYYSPLLSQFETAYPPPVIPTGTPEVGTENIPSPTSTASILEVTMIFPTNTPSRTPSPTDAKIPGEKAKIQDSKNTTSYGLIFLVAILWLLLGGWLYLLIREKG